MKKTIGLLSLAMVITIILSGCASTSLGQFGAETGIQDNPIPGGDPIRIPYTSTVRYFGFVEPGQEADALVDSKKVYYLYVWIPLVTPELGIRMLSPSAGVVEPEEGDIVAPGYAELSEANPEAYFDTWISLERADTIIDPADIASAASASWSMIDSNDDSSEMPAQPSGSLYNSLLRVTADQTPLVRGLYRIGFTTFKVGEVQGSFFAEVGSPIDLPGVVIARTADEVAELVNE